MDFALYKYSSFSILYGYDFNIVKSWWEHMNFATFDEAKSFFETNKSMIQAKPFVKWVGGKRQILPQLQKLFPTEFNNYHEPFLGGGAVFFNIQKKQSFLSDGNHSTDFIREIYKGFRFEIVKARRNVNSKASGRGEVEEIIAMNY